VCWFEPQGVGKNDDPLMTLQGVAAHQLTGEFGIAVFEFLIYTSHGQRKRMAGLKSIEVLVRGHGPG